jgi:hypothetical protein
MAITALCSCCGLERDRVAALQCHDEVRICQECTGWLRGRLGVVDVTPILPVVEMSSAARFYRAAGFEVRMYEESGGYAFVSLHEESVFDLDQWESPFDPRQNRAGCYLIVPDVDEWHRRLSGLGLAVNDIEDKPWGMREFTLTDPSGNYLRIGRSVP